MRRFGLSFFILIFFLLQGCVFKNSVLQSKSYIVVIKMKNMAFNDTGFLNKSKDFTELQLFSAGNLVLDLKVGEYICLNSHCFNKEEFNKKFLSKDYNPQTLENILNARAIFNKMGYKKDNDGFSQIIVKKNLHIKYFVRKDKIYFKDYKNHILIKLTPLKR
jgi:hypothetical protein